MRRESDLGQRLTPRDLEINFRQLKTACGQATGLPSGSGTELQYRASATTFGALTGSTFSGGNLTLNDTGIDSDFRIEAVGQVNAFFVQGSNGFVGVGTGTPSSPFHLLNAVGNLLIEDTNDRGVLQIRNGQAAPPADTVAGRIAFQAKDDAGATESYARIDGIVTDDTAGSEHGYLEIATQRAGTMTVAAKFDNLGVFTLPALTNCNTIDTNGSGVFSCGTDAGSPGGSGSQLQYRVNGTTFGGISGSSISGSNVVFGGTVGVNGVTATEELHVRGTTAVFLRVESTNANSTAGIKLDNDVQDWSLEIQTTDDFVIKDEGTIIFEIEDGAPASSLVIESGGDVAIPWVKLTDGFSMPNGSATLPVCNGARNGDFERDTTGGDAICWCDSNNWLHVVGVQTACL